MGGAGRVAAATAGEKGVSNGGKKHDRMFFNKCKWLQTTDIPHI